MMNLPLSDMAKQVYLIMTVMPAMTQLGIVAKEARADYEFAAMTIAVTTVIRQAVSRRASLPLSTEESTAQMSVSRMQKNGKF